MTRARQRTTYALIAFAIMFAGLQFANPEHTNPGSDEALAIERTERLPAGVARTLDLACRDCHSHRTQWRWYTYVAPVSWWTVGHVNDGRAELNFSEWGTYGRRARETRLRAMCALTEAHAMPLRAYAIVHPEARVSDSALRQLCAWTQQAIAEGPASAVASFADARCRTQARPRRQCRPRSSGADPAAAARSRVRR